MADFEDREIRVNNLRLCYLDWENYSARPVVLLHGLWGYAHYWDFFAKSMSSEYHIIALDQRGHGDSDRAESYSIKDYVQDLEAFVKELGLGNILLIGHSMAGITGVLYAARNPEKVAKLIIVDIGPELSPTGTERMQKEIESKPESFRDENEVAQFLRYRDPLQSQEVIEHHLRHSLTRNETGNLIFKHDKALDKPNLQSPEFLWDQLHKLTCSTLLVHGVESDFLTDETAQAMIEAMPNGALVNIDGAGHDAPLDNPGGFESAVRDFLQRTD